MENAFFALLFRQKYIKRWALMRNLEDEPLSQHSMECAVVAHALALVAKRVFGRDCDEAQAALLALYHDAPEVFTGDMPTPAKYYSPRMRESYAEIEHSAQRRLLDALPAELRGDYAPLIMSDENTYCARIVRAADKLCALIKCEREISGGNAEFVSAREKITRSLREMNMEEADWFIEKLMPAFTLTLDETSL